MKIDVVLLQTKTDPFNGNPKRELCGILYLSSASTVF